MIIAPEAPQTQTVRVPVLKVFDGDGFLTRLEPSNSDAKLGTELAVRFGFIDAPELGQPGGREARDFLASLIAGQWLELVVLTKMDTGKIVDRYKRLVCVPYLTAQYSSDDLRSLNADLRLPLMFGDRLVVTRNIELEMVLNGWAWVLERYCPDERYLHALEDARRSKRGIWARESNVDPWDFKKRTHRQRRSQAEPGGQSACTAEGCDGHFVRRVGRYGQFMGCSNFPRCRKTMSNAWVAEPA